MPVHVAGGTFERDLLLENISLGGAFVCTGQAPVVRSRVVVTLPAELQRLELTGRIVHVLDVTRAQQKRHPEGIGIQFERLPAATLQKLEAVIGEIACEARLVRVNAPDVRFVNPGLVAVTTVRPVLASLWEGGLHDGALWAEGNAPPVGATVEVVVGPLRFEAEVVLADEGRGTGLSVLGLDGERRDAIVRYLEEASPVIHCPDDADAQRSSRSVRRALALARRLSFGAEDNDPLGALGLATTATEADVRRRVASLLHTLEKTATNAAPHHRARFDNALRLLERLLPAALDHAVAAGLEELDDVEVTEVVDADPIATTGEVAALMLDDDEGTGEVKRSLPPARDDRKAMELVSAAEVYVTGGMKREAVTDAQQAIDLSDSAVIRLRAARVLAKAGLDGDALAVVEEVLAADPKDAAALQALMALHEKCKLWTEAHRAGQSLLKQRPADAALAKRVKKLAQLANA